MSPESRAGGGKSKRDWETEKLRERERHIERERERGRFGWPRITWARIRLIKLRIRAASRKWNYRDVVDGGGGKCIGSRTVSRYHRYHQEEVVTFSARCSGGIWGSNSETACVSNREKGRGGRKDSELTGQRRVYIYDPKPAWRDREKFQEPWEFKLSRIWLRPTDFSSFPSPSTSSSVSIIRFGIASLSLRRGEEESDGHLLGSQVEFSAADRLSTFDVSCEKYRFFSSITRVRLKITWKIARVMFAIVCDFLFRNEKAMPRL